MPRMGNAVYDCMNIDERASSHRVGKWSLALMFVILSAGIFLRAWPTTGFHGVGYDEGIYARYVKTALKEGIWNYPDIARAYVKWQEERSDAVVPATRIGFLLPASALAAVSRLDPLTALRCISLVSSVLLLLATAIIAYRLGGSERMLLLTVLMAAAPLQIHLAQRSLADGYFAFWAVLCAWFLWENLQTPKHKGWLAGYGFGLFVLVLTKENAAFVFAALIIVSIVFASFKLGRGSVFLFVVSFLAPALAVLTLAALVGGIGEWISFYRMFVQKSAALSYPILFQDGAWYRYLIDFTLLSPLVTVLALGALFQIDRESRPDVFWALFLGASYGLMSAVPYGMSLRFAAYWDLPLRWLALSQVLQMAKKPPRIRPLFALAGVILILAAVDLFQYWRYFVHAQIYDPVSFQLLRASRLIK